MEKNNYIELVNVVKMHDYKYWTLNEPAITDEQYDKLYAQLQEAEEQHPEWVVPDSPTQVISTATNGNNRRVVRRRKIMLSTEKVNSVEKLNKWMGKTTKAASKLGCKSAGHFIMEWKYDGESCSLVYMDGELIEASTGKGMDGMDALNHVLCIPSVPQYIDVEGRVEIRGEVVCPFANLERTGYKTCRSAAAGYLANAVADENIGKLMEFHPYYVEGYELTPAFMYMPIHLQSLAQLAKYEGFEYTTAFLVTAAEAEMYIEQCMNERSNLPFPTDGLVFKCFDASKWDEFGATDHHPKYCVAYKFPGVTAETVLRKVEITIGEKTGKRTPVAHFDPVVMNGATYSKCSCGSEDTFAAKGISVGDKIIVTLANDVICQVVGKANK